MDDLVNLPNEPEKIQNPITEPPPMPAPVPFPVQVPEPKIISSPVVVPPLPPVEVPAPILPSVVKEKKEPVLFFILAGILIVAGLAFSAYNFYQTKLIQTKPNLTPTSMPQPTVSVPTPTPDPTANWKVYSNAKYSYSLKYPSEWEQLETNNGNYVRFFKGPYTSGQPTPETYISILSKEKGKISLESWLLANGLLPTAGQPDSHIHSENVNISGVSGIKISTPVNGGQDAIYLPIGNELLQITYIFKGENQTDYSNLVTTFDQILSTFKFTSNLTPTPTLKGGVSDLKTYNYNKIMFNYPADWDLQPQVASGSSITQEIKDKSGTYLFTFQIQANLNNATGKPYKDLNEFINMPYELKKLTVGGQEAVQALPRAGSENIDQVYFFSKDIKNVLSLKLETPVDGSKMDEGTKIFDQILASFKFNN